MASLMFIFTNFFVQAQETKDFGSIQNKVLEAKKKGNVGEADSISGDYIDNYLLKLREEELYTKDNLNFISQNFSNEKSKAFKLFVKRSNKVNTVLGDYEAQNRIIDFIVANYLPKEDNWKAEKPDWNEIEKEITKRFGAIGREAVLGQRMVYYWRIGNDWNNYAKYYTLYFQLALKHTRFYTNNFSWSIFEHINEPKVLSFACDVVMKYVIENGDQYDYYAYDTYANLLYKTGNKEQAIEWEEKALKLSSANSGIVETLEKMKKGEKTWPN